MARRKPKPSYVLEMSLKTTPQDERRLQRGLFEAAKRINNALLQEGLKTVQALRDDPGWNLARTMARATKEQREASADAFRAVRMAHGFSDFDFQALAIKLKNDAGFAGRLASNVTQKLGTKAFLALEQHLLGVRGRPRFKGVKRPLHSVEDKTNAAALRWNEDDGCVYIDSTWCISANFPDLKRDEWFWHALQAPVKYCRVLWRMVRGERKYFVQLVMDGQAPMKESLRSRLAAEGTRPAAPDRPAAPGEQSGQLR